ncbi:MAG: hypothetical protein IT208_10195 [Chthonomonadales bacterium]|nr:hypothetical protein [Chthonomonadales bacterium]
MRALALLGAALAVLFARGARAPAPDAYPSDEKWTAQWIWGEVSPHGSLGLFRKEVTLPAAPVSAWAQMSGDDGYEVFVNGQSVFRGGFWWKRTDRVDLRPYLRAGANAIAARVVNAADPGGLLCQVDIAFAGERPPIRVATNRSWRFRASEPEADWKSPDYDDDNWSACKELGSPPTAGPWRDLPLVYMGPRYPIELVSVSATPRLRAGDEIVLRLTLRAGRGVLGCPPLSVRLSAPGAATISRTVAVSPPPNRWRPGDAVTLAPIRIPVSPYARPGRYTLEAGLRRSRYTRAEIRGFAIASVEVTPRRPPGSVTPCRVGPHNGAPTLFVAGRPVSPVWVFQWRPRAEEVRAMRRGGVHIWTFDLPVGWTGPGRFDFAEADQTILEVLQADPDALIVPRVWMRAPPSWIDAHPLEAVRFADGTGWVDNGWGGTKHESFASRLWRRDACEALRRFVRHVAASPYSDRVIGYHVANGIYGEWHAWSATNYPDTSEPMRRYLGEFARRRYAGSVARLRAAWGQPDAEFGTVRCPGIEERLRGDVGVFRDPARSRWAADYYEAMHNATADSIEALCRTVKEETRGRAITVVFYAYWPDLDWPQEGDHRAPARILRSRWVDAVSSPHSYARRRLGEDGLFRNFPAAAALHGKLFIDEGDDRTHLATDPAFTHVSDLAGSLAVIRREWMNALTHNTGVWYMDQQGSWFRDPAIRHEIALGHRWGERALRMDRRRTAQVALVADPAAAFHMAGRGPGRDRIGMRLFVDQVGAMCRAGAPFDVYTVEDLADPRMPAYRLYVMLNCYYLTGAQRAAVLRRTRQPGTTTLWFYAPGYVTDSGLSTRTMRTLTGIEIGVRPDGRAMLLRAEGGLTAAAGAEAFGFDDRQTPAFVPEEGGAEILARYTAGGEAACVRKRIQGSTAVYCASAPMPAGALRKLYEDAGVFVYAASGDVLTANASFVGLHTVTGGSKRVRIPERASVFDATTGRRVATRAAEFTVDVPAHATRVWALHRSGGPAAATARVSRRRAR